MSYLNEQHPEIFWMSPRPGGIAKIDIPEDVQVVGKGSKTTIRSSKSLRSTRSSASRSKSIFDANFLSALTGYVCRDYRIKNVMATSPWVLFDEEQDPAKPPNPLQDTIDVLAITITTIMLLAADYKDIPNSHLKWTMSYLECVKDEFGHCPPNVRGILNHIKMKDETLVSFNEHFESEVYGDEEEIGAPKTAELASQDAPATEKKPSPTDESTPADEPASADEPVPADEPTPAEEPAPADEPTPADEPAAVDEPAPLEQPASEE